MNERATGTEHNACAELADPIKPLRKIDPLAPGRFGETLFIPPRDKQ